MGGGQASFEASNLYTVTNVRDVTSSAPGFSITPRSQISLPHGSALYKAPTYNLWDASKIAGCICDPGFHGHDCSLRVCPGGHDPLDVQGEDKIDTNSATSTTNPSTFTKTNERQMLSMDSSHGAVSGTFQVVFTDAKGIEHRSSSISATPMLSSTVRVGAPNIIDDTYCKEGNKANYAVGHIGNGFEGCYKVVYFSPDLPETELSVGDHIRVGQDIRSVSALTRNLLTGGYSSATVASQFSSTYGAGTYAYRQSAATALKGALEGLPNGACGPVDVARSLSGGTLLFTNLNVASKAVVTAVGDETTNSASSVQAGSTTKISPANDIDRDAAREGDIVRIHHNVGQMQVTSMVVAASLIDTLSGSPRAFTSTDDDGVPSDVHQAVLVKENGFNYKIKFNGNSGDLDDLVCDSSNLRPVYRMSAAGYVSRDEPDRIYFVDVTQGSSQPAYTQVSQSNSAHPEAVSAGDVVYIGEQRCDVIAADDDMTQKAKANVNIITTYGYQANSIVCRNALKANAHSTADALYTHETLEVFLGDETVSCASTDTPSLRFVRRGAGASQDAECNNGEGCADVYDNNGEKRMVAHASASAQPTNAVKAENTLLDLDDLAVGDRVMIDTLGYTQEIRTVDSINIGQATGAIQNNYFTVSQPFSAGHANKDIYLYWKGSTGSATCSGRGICDEGTGDCQCFRGYTGQACEVQNALAA